MALTTVLVICGGLALAQSNAVQIQVASIVLVEPAAETPLPIQIGPATAIPRQAFVRIRGLPATATLSDGHMIKAGSWAVPIATLANLTIEAPVGSEGRFQMWIALLAVSGEVMREVEATLIVAPAPTVAAPPARQPAPTASTSTLATTAAPLVITPPNLPPVVAALPQRPTPERDVQPVPRAAPLPIPQAVAPPSPAPTPLPALSAADRERAAKLVARGDEGMAAGDVNKARLFYGPAAEMGWAPAALALAGTYDPNQLAQYKVLGGISADPAMARKWYQRARDLGAPQAEARLQRLGAR